MPQPIHRRFSGWLQDELRPGVLLPGVTSGVILGITEVIFAISLGSLVFSGELATSLSRGVGIAVFTAGVMMFITSVASGVPGVIGSTQDTSSVMLAVIASGLVSTLPGADPEERLATVVVAIALATLLMGLFFVALGALKLGGLVRYVPYPVVGGFLAGTGWLLVQGSFGVMTDLPLRLANVPSLIRPDHLIQWMPGLLFALAMYFGLRTVKHVLALPGILIGGVVLFYLVLLAMGISLPEAVERGLLLGQWSGGATWQPLLPSDLWDANWATIAGQSGNMGIILILSLVGLLLNASALELSIRGDIDFNRELKAAGAANILSGLGGGMAGYHALSLSTLSYRMGARGRLPGLVAGSVCVVILAVGTSMLALFPKPVLGGLLLFLGLDFLLEWVVAGWRKLSRTDYGIVLLILAIIAATDFLIGVAAGLIASIILFVLSYSRIDVVRHAFSGADFRSNVERCTYHRQALADLGDRIFILELQGFIFFGTAHWLLEQVKARLADSQRARVHYLILDFRRVSGLDSSAGMSFDKARQLAGAQGIAFVLTHISERIRHQLGLDSLPEKGLHVFPDLDRGLEWCEEQLLEINQITGLHTPVALVAQLADGGFARGNTTRLRGYLERMVFKEGDYLIRQGDDADALFFVELGSVSVCLETAGGERVRLQTYGLGTAVGEMDLYQGVKCTASVIADSAVTAYRLTRQTLLEMKEKDPELAAAFHEFIAHLLSERLAATTRTLQAAIH